VAKYIRHSGRSSRKVLGTLNDDEWWKLCNELQYYPVYSSLEDSSYQQRMSADRKVPEPYRKIARSDQLAMLAKLHILYRYYIGDAIVGNWTNFVEKVREMKRLRYQMVITEREYAEFMEPFNEKFGFDVAKVIEYVECIKHNFFLHSAKDQSLFVEKCETFDFWEDFKQFTTQMLSQLKSVSVFRDIKGDEWPFKWLEAYWREEQDFNEGETWNLSK
jgi:hypothetical protein